MAHDGSSGAPHLVIRPRGRFTGVNLREAWRYRDVLRAFAARDFTLRYRQTMLGVTWIILQPLLAALSFAFVFGRVAGLRSEGVPYLVFALAGLLAWNAFNGVVTRGSLSLAAVGPMVSKVYFPRILLPLATLGSVLLDFVVALVIEIVLLLVSGVSLSWPLLLLPIWPVMIMGLGSGIALIASALAVRYRDVLQILPMAMQLMLFLSPVGYSVGAVPKDVRWAVAVNPLTGTLQGIRWSLFGRGSVGGWQVAWSAVAALLAVTAGAYVFSSLERDFADVI